MPTSEKVRALNGQRGAARRWGHPTDELDREYATEVLADHIKRVVDTFPPLNPEQRERLAGLLRGGAHA